MNVTKHCNIGTHIRKSRKLYTAWLCNFKVLNHLRWLVIYVTLFWKTDQVVTFGISRNTDFKYLIHCCSLVLVCSHAIYVTRHEKIGLMCTWNLTFVQTLIFYNFVPKHTSSMKLLQIVQQRIENLMQFTEVLQLTQNLR